MRWRMRAWTSAERYSRQHVHRAPPPIWTQGWSIQPGYVVLRLRNGSLVIVKGKRRDGASKGNPRCWLSESPDHCCTESLIISCGSWWYIECFIYPAGSWAVGVWIHCPVTVDFICYVNLPIYGKGSEKRYKLQKNSVRIFIIIQTNVMMCELF